MNIYKYNLFINNSFDSYKFINNKDESLFNVIDSNLLEYSIFLTPSSKPENSTDYITLNINDIKEFYIYPTSSNNVSISVNEILQTSDNNAIFVITNYIEKNKFSLKLV